MIKKLIKREISSLAACFEQYLCIEKINDTYRLGNYEHKILESIHNIFVEDDLYDEEGNIVVPQYISGHKVIGLSDGEYPIIEDLIVREYVLLSMYDEQVIDNYLDKESWVANNKIDLLNQIKMFIKRES